MNNIYGAALIAVCAAFTVPAADLKTGEAVLDNYVEVTGGADAWAKVHSMMMKGSMSMPAMGIKGAVTIYAAEPNKLAMATDLGAVGKVVEGSDGTNAWTFSSMQGPQLKKGEELSDSLRGAFFHKENEWRTIYSSAEIVGTEDVDGKPAYKVTLTPKAGKPETQYYDKASGLLVRHQKRPQDRLRRDPGGRLFKRLSQGLRHQAPAFDLRKRRRPEDRIADRHRGLQQRTPSRRLPTPR